MNFYSAITQISEHGEYILLIIFATVFVSEEIFMPLIVYMMPVRITTISVGAD